MLPKLQFITQPVVNYSTAELIEQVCLGGIKLIQLRLKNCSPETIYSEAKLGAEICKKYNVTFILNDYVSIAKELNLDGVHLGKTDLSPILAREILGNNKIIGGTANDLNDIKHLIKAKVNYIGLGPYQFTTTKKQLSPTLGIEGYEKTIAALTNITTPPIYAIGGIEPTSIQPILDTGIFGIAVSGLIAKSNNIIETTKKIVQLVS